MFAVTSAAMRELDRLTIEELGVPAAQLMERAARAVVRFAEERYPNVLAGRIGILCGPGNNGGDGKFAARLLQQRGVLVQVVQLGSLAQWHADRAPLLESDLIIDALFGVGLSRPLEGAAKAIIEDINRMYAGPVVAVDIPSGLSADAGAGACVSGARGEAAPGPAPAIWSGATMRANATVTFTAPKPGHFLAPNSHLTGALRVVSIGTPAEKIHSLLRVTTPADCRPYLKPRVRDSHKGSYGHVLVIGGSVGKSGAVALASAAALRAGAGLVTAAVPRSVLPLVAAARPEIMTEPLPETGDGRLTAEGLGPVLEFLMRSANVIAAGPGATQEPASASALRHIVAAATLPLVLDADGLNAFDGRRHELRLPNGGVLTPHPGEMARLFDVSTAEVQHARLGYAQRLARETGTVVVLKGHRSLIASPDGEVYVNTSGNPGMATGGSGDTLTGIIAGLLAQFPNEPRLPTVAVAVYLHGLAGDLAAAARGEMGMLAGDITAHLHAAITATRNQNDDLPYDIPA